MRHSEASRSYDWGWLATKDACDGRAQVTLGYMFGGQSDCGQADHIRTGPTGTLSHSPVPLPIRTCCVSPHNRLHMQQHSHCI